MLDPDELLLEHVDEIETPGGGEEIDLEFGYSATAYAAVGLEANARMTWPTAAKAPPPHETDGPQWQMTTFLTVAKPEGGARRSDEWRMLVLNFRWVDCHWCAPVYPTFLPTVELETVRQLLEFGDLDWVVPTSEALEVQ